MNKSRSKERGKGKKDSKTANINFRVLPEVKSVLESRANAAGMSLTDYLIRNGLADIAEFYGLEELI